MRASLAGCLLLVPLTAAAQTASDSFDVRVTVAAECRIASAGTLDFGNAGVLTGNVDATSTLQVACTNSTPYNVGLNLGQGAGADVTARRMTSSAGATIGYQLFRDGAYSARWGNTVGVDTQAGIGTGAAQSFIVYGRIAAQTTPAPGTYTDTVIVTVTY